MDHLFAPYLARWGLEPDGEAFASLAAHLMPVRQNGVPAMLKVSHGEDERLGAVLMSWWDGNGAARVLAHDGDALLLERAMGPRSLADMARGQEDDEATRILCTVARKLHEGHGEPPRELVPLDRWFRDLTEATDGGGILSRAGATARRLLTEPRDIAVLHGDLHHDNVLDFGPRGWLAIDPKRLIGERTFDYCNIFTNPDLSDPARPVAVRPGVFERRLEIVLAQTGFERVRMLEWILAWCGLSAVWYLSDGDEAETDLTIAALACAELDR